MIANLLWLNGYGFRLVEKRGDVEPGTGSLSGVVKIKHLFSTRYKTKIVY